MKQVSGGVIRPCLPVKQHGYVHIFSTCLTEATTFLPTGKPLTYQGGPQ